MTLTLIVSGLFFFTIGSLLLPPRPATPEMIGASLAPMAFFFGGASVIIGFFGLKNPGHRRVAGFLLAAMAAVYGAYVLLTRARESHTLTLFAAGLLVYALVVGLSGRKKGR